MDTLNQNLLCVVGLLKMFLPSSPLNACMTTSMETSHIVHNEAGGRGDETADSGVSSGDGNKVDQIDSTNKAASGSSSSRPTFLNIDPSVRKGNRIAATIPGLESGSTNDKKSESTPPAITNYAKDLVENLLTSLHSSSPSNKEVK